MACLVQYARTHAGRARLRERVTLDRAATSKIDADVRCGEFTHTPCAQPFERVFVAVGYPLAAPVSIGENLAWAQGPLGEPRRIMRAWLDSPEHRQTLLSTNWKSFGLGARRDTTFLGYRDATLWATEFGSR